MHITALRALMYAENERENFLDMPKIFLLTSIFAAHPLKIIFHPTSTSSMGQPPEPRSSPPSHLHAQHRWSLITPARSISTPRKHGRNLISAGTLSWMSPFIPAGGRFMGTRSVANMKPILYLIYYIPKARPVGVPGVATTPHYPAPRVILAKLALLASRCPPERADAASLAYYPSGRG